MSKTEQRKESAQGRAGTDHISRVVLELRELLDRGILIDITVHGINLFYLATSWTEWGFADGDPRQSHMKKGHRSTAQELHGKLRSAETRLRDLARRFGRSVNGLGGWSWIPYTAYDDFTTEWDRINGELIAARDEIINRRDEFVAILSRDMSDGARKAWASIVAQRPDDAGPFVLVENGSTFETVEQYAQHECERARSIFPTADDIRKKVYAVYNNAILMTSAELLTEHAQEEQATRDAAVARMETQQANDDSRRSQLQADLDIRALEEAQKARVSAMRNAEIQRAREMIQDVKSPWQDVIDQFRADVNTKVVKLQKSLMKNGCLKGRAMGMARDLHALYQLMASATDDHDLEDRLRDLSTLVSHPAGSAAAPSPQEVAQALADIKSFTDDAFREISQAARAARKKTAVDVIDL